MAKYTTAQIEEIREMLKQAGVRGVQLNIFRETQCGSTWQQNSLSRKRENSRKVRRATATKYVQYDLFGGFSPHDP